MDFETIAQTMSKGGAAAFPTEAATREYAQKLDTQDPVRHMRDEFIFPTKTSLKQPLKTAEATNGVNGHHDKDGGDNEDEKVVYFCGNSLGLQPKRLRASVDAHLQTWAAVGVHGHFRAPAGSPLPAWQDLAEACAARMAPIVGARPSEVVAMNTLTVNLHLLLASFYRPDATRHKILIEWKPFPSDYYAVSSHLRWCGRDPRQSMVEIAPDEGHALTTAHVLATIDAHADDAALLLLPGLQYYSGQLFDMAAITAHARARGLVVGWDLAHAAGNVPLALHDWGVDFAAWCTYKYLNAGPGAMAGAFVHERHGGVTFAPAEGKEGKGEEGKEGEEERIPQYRPRLQGWYGVDKSVRFNMSKTFQPTPGAAGFQLSNPSAIDLASLAGALGVWEGTSVAELRRKGLVLTAYAEHLLDGILADEKQEQKQKEGEGEEEPAFTIITPRDPRERGAQLCVLLRAGLLERVVAAFEHDGVVCDQRKPDVIRVAPVPLYNSFEDVWKCVDALRRAILR
ncbi:kynureninase [Xylariaceae sp. FL0804]|nr:kynureninase [Xylariaceae sp. FL0804]